MRGMTVSEEITNNLDALEYELILSMIDRHLKDNESNPDYYALIRNIKFKLLNQVKEKIIASQVVEDA